MFYAMGPVHNHKFEEEIDNADRMSQHESRSRCTTPDNDNQCLQSPRSTFSCPGVIEHDSERRHADAWMGYSSGLWPRQHDMYSSHHSRQHPLNLQQQQQQHQQPQRQQQQQLQQLSSSSSWQDSTCMSLPSLGGAHTYEKEQSPTTEKPDDFSQPSSTNQCDSQSRHRSAPRRLPTSPPTGLVDLRDLTEPIDMVSGSNCIPLSEKCIKYSLSMEMSKVGSSNNIGSLLKRKLSSSFGKSEETSPSLISGQMSDEARAEKRRRFTRTTETLKRLGLWEVAIRTGKMIVQNRQLQKELDQLRQDSRQLMLSVLKNPENENLKRALVTMKARINAHKHQSFRNCNVPVKS